MQKFRVADCKITSVRVGSRLTMYIVHGPTGILVEDTKHNLPAFKLRRQLLALLKEKVAQAPGVKGAR